MSDTTTPSKSASAARTAGFLAGGTALFGILGIQVGLLQPLTGFYLFALGAIVGGLTALSLGVFGIVATRDGANRSGRAQALVGGCIGAALIGATLSAASSGGNVPAINDITTNLQDPPSFAAALEAPENQGRDMAYPDDFVPQVEAAYPDLNPLRIDRPANQSYQRALQVAEGLGWEITTKDPATGRFEARHISRVFRFVDDIAVRVRPDGTGSVIDLRSKSRDGRGDMGANADRIRAFAANYEDLPAVATK